MNEYLKKIGKYLLSLAAVSCVGSAKYDFGDNLDTKVKEQYRQELVVGVESAKTKVQRIMYEASNSRELSKEDQILLDANLEQIIDNNQLLGKETSPEYLQMHDLVEENLSGVDYGTPNLESALREQGYPISVEPVEVSTKELLLPFLYLFGGVFTLFYLKKKIRGREY
ncbi:MAG: hypothetical protein AABX04_00620 [Nanoarchaeota archaeon]